MSRSLYFGAAQFGALAFFALSLSGCGPSSEPGLEQNTTCVNKANPGMLAALTLGTVEAGPFREFTQGEELSMEFGPQGGQHVYYSLQVFGALEGDSLDAKLVTPEEVTAGSSPLFTFTKGAPECASSQWMEIQNRRLFLDKKDSVTGTLRVSLNRSSAALATAETTISVAP